jgi:hypothetical protein
MLTTKLIIPALLLSLSSIILAAEPPAIPLWPASDPGAAEQEKLRDLTPGKLDRFISEVRHPTLTVYLPPADKATGAAIIICPGGGYSGVAIDREGHDVAR